MTSVTPPLRFAKVRLLISRARAWAEGTILWQVWERMLEIEFVDRSVALAGKAFVSFFPLVIVVAAFMPPGVRSSIFTTMTHQLGIGGASLATAKEAFSSADDVRRATGALGLVLTLFFATSFTTAMQRIYLRAWRRDPGGKLSEYTRGPAWLIAVVAYMAVLGAARGTAGDSAGFAVVFAVVVLATSMGLWWFTAWFLLLGQVRPRVLIPTGAITGLAMACYTAAASIWMPAVVTRNETQFGFFGVALALVTWFSGAATCILVGACAGPVLAEDAGRVGRLIRGPSPELLIAGAVPSLPAPTRDLRLRDAFRAEQDPADVAAAITSPTQSVPDTRDEPAR